ncbi:nickel-responsive transcriptional regulator NikR [candidate division WOR-3 bacterium]|nr:nickel-responsive transcriptional regulator NikR [candidate division WOR-3 bacterium]
MAEAVRFGISMSKELLRDFDRLISKIGYPNRSEAIRNLIRERLVQQEWEASDEETIGAITIVYSHEVRELTERLTELQHKFCRQIISTMHIHLDKHNCLEILAVKGKGRELKKIADRLLSTKGIKHGRLTTTTTGKKLL